MPDILASKTPDGMLSVLPEFRDTLDYVGNGEIVKVKVTKSRNLTNHRRFFALLKACWNLEQISDHFDSMDDLRAWVTVRTGHCTTLHLDDDVVVKIPKSISFSSMDDIDFTRFYNNAVNVVLNRFLPEFKPDDFLDYIDQFARF